MPYIVIIYSKEDALMVVCCVSSGLRLEMEFTRKNLDILKKFKFLMQGQGNMKPVILQLKLELYLGRVLKVPHLH